MEYTLDSYLRSGGKIFTTSNGYKYLKYKVKKTKAYLRCVLWKKGCKGTSKMNLDTDIIYPSSIHNHDIELYQSEVYDLKTRCKKVARSSQGSLRKLFDDVTRTDPYACQISFNECESSMFVRGGKHNQRFLLMLKSFRKCYQELPTHNTINLRSLLILKLQ